MSAKALTWSRAVPTAPGWYWTRCLPAFCEEVLEVVRVPRVGLRLLAGSSLVDPVALAGSGREWAGPIVAPIDAGDSARKGANFS